MLRGANAPGRPAANHPPGGNNTQQPRASRQPLNALGSVKALGGTKVLQGFAQELQRLQRRSQQAATAATQGGGSVVDFLVAQVSVLQEAFVCLADAVTQELDGVSRQAARWQSDRQEWLTTIVDMRQEASDKLLQVERAQAQAGVDLQAARTELQGVVLRQAQRVDQESQGVSRQVAQARVDVQMLRNEVVEMRTLTSKDFPNEVLRQRLLDKAQMEEAISQSIHEVVPRLVGEAVQDHAPAAVHAQVGASLRDMVDQRTEPIRHEVTRMVEQMASEVGTVGVELASLAGAVQALTERAKAMEERCEACDMRVAALEGLELPLLGGLQDRVDLVSAQQSKFAQSMQEVVTALVDDATDVSRELRSMQARAEGHAQLLDHTREALARCATVFSALHGVPSPVPVAALTSSRALAGMDLMGHDAAPT